MFLNGFLNEPENDLDVVVVTDDELNGVIEEVAAIPRNDPRRRKFVNRMKKGMRNTPKAKGGNVATKDLTAKAEFEKRIHQLPPELQKDLKSARLQIVDGDIYSIKSISGKQAIELLENKDDKTVGLTNLNGRKLDNGQYFLMTGIQLLFGTAKDNTPEALKITDFKELVPSFIKNGEINIVLGTEVLIPESSCEIFNTDGRAEIPKGYYKLENPKWLKPLTEIKPEIKFAGVAPDLSAVKFRIIGATVGKM